MNIPFVQDTTFSGVISTKNYGTSEDWYNAFTAISAIVFTNNTTTKSMTATDNYLKIFINGTEKYLQLFALSAT